MVEHKGGCPVKRDSLLLTLCVCLLGLGVWLGAERVQSAVSATANNEWVLVIDAGHGGEDGGASTASGKKESEINLEIALKMESLMGFLGVNTHLTRQDDRSLHNGDAKTLHEKKVSDLKNRVAEVNSFSNAFLLSIHQNYFPDSQSDGAQVFSNDGDVSRQWGEGTQAILRQVLDETNGRAAKPVPSNIYLFEHVNCPAILVECGFLSNGAEASLLQTDVYQRKIVLALAGAYLQEIQMIPTVWGGT